MKNLNKQPRIVMDVCGVECLYVSMGFNIATHNHQTNLAVNQRLLNQGLFTTPLHAQGQRQERRNLRRKFK